MLLQVAPIHTPLVIFGDNLNTLSILKSREAKTEEEKQIIQQINLRKAPTTPFHI
jgi:hypothetical protein